MIDAKKLQTHGGARKGAGRKPADPRNPRNRTAMIRLTDAEIRAAERLGDGNVGAGIRRALQIAQRPA